MFDSICGYICFIHFYTVEYNFGNCVDSKYVYIFCNLEWPRGINFVMSLPFSFI